MDNNYQIKKRRKYWRRHEYCEYSRHWRVIKLQEKSMVEQCYRTEVINTKTNINYNIIDQADLTLEPNVVQNPSFNYNEIIEVKNTKNLHSLTLGAFTVFTFSHYMEKDKEKKDDEI